MKKKQTTKTKSTKRQSDGIDALSEEFLSLVRKPHLEKAQKLFPDDNNARLAAMRSIESHIEAFKIFAADTSADLRGGWKFISSTPHRLFRIASCCQSFLSLLAESQDEEAARWLHCLADDSVRSIANICEDHPEFFGECVDPGNYWPVMTNGSPDSIADVKKLLLKIGVLRPGRGLSFMTVETAMAHYFWGTLKIFQKVGGDKIQPEALQVPFALAQKLGKLSQDNYQQWAKAAQPLLEMFHGKNFEDSSSFSKYWKSKAYDDLSPRAKRSHIRRDIKRNIKQAFKSLARHVVN